MRMRACDEQFVYVIVKKMKSIKFVVFAVYNIHFILR